MKQVSNNRLSRKSPTSFGAYGRLIPVIVMVGSAVLAVACGKSGNSSVSVHSVDSAKALVGMISSVYGSDYDYTQASNEALAERVEGASAFITTGLAGASASQVRVAVELTAESDKTTANDLTLTGTLDSTVQKKGSH